MKIKTSRFGELEIDENLFFEMVDPILGYEDEKKFVLIEHKENSCFKWLQSVKTPELAIVITMAGLFGIDYSFELPDNIQEDLKITQEEEVLAFNVVVIPHENPKASTINLLAPIIFNIKNRKGAQIVLANPNLKIDHPLFQKEVIC